MVKTPVDGSLVKKIFDIQETDVELWNMNIIRICF